MYTRTTRESFPMHLEIEQSISFSWIPLSFLWFFSCRTRAGFSRGDQYYASFAAGTELLTDTTKVCKKRTCQSHRSFAVLYLYFLLNIVCWQLYKAALANCFEEEEWGPIEFSVMAKHFERQGKSPYAYHSVSLVPFIQVLNFMKLHNFSMFIFLKCKTSI